MAYKYPQVTKGEKGSQTFTLEAANPRGKLGDPAVLQPDASPPALCVNTDPRLYLNRMPKLVASATPPTKNTFDDL